MGADMLDMERKVARCRVLLSLMALFAVWVDPTRATSMPWLRPVHAVYGIDPRALALLMLHLAFRLSIYAVLSRPLVTSPRTVIFTTAIDVLFSLVIAIFTEGIASPFYVFFTFAIVAAAVRSGFKFSMAVTAVCIWLYL